MNFNVRRMMQAGIEGYPNYRTNPRANSDVTGMMIQDCLTLHGFESYGNPIVDSYAFKNINNDGSLVDPIIFDGDLNADLFFPSLPIPEERIYTNCAAIFGDDGMYMIGRAASGDDKFTFIGNLNCPAVLHAYPHEGEADVYGVFVPFERDTDEPEISQRNAYISKAMIDAFSSKSGELNIDLDKLAAVTAKDDKAHVMVNPNAAADVMKEFFSR